MIIFKVSAVATAIGGVVLFFQSPAAQTIPIPDSVFEIAKLLILALPGYLASRYHARREQKKAEAARDDRLLSSWESMSLQQRDQMMQAFQDAAKEKGLRLVAEQRAEDAERRVAELEDELRRKTAKKPRGANDV